MGIAMRRLTASVPVRAPSGFTLAFAWSYFKQQAEVPGTSNLPLRLPLDAIARGLALHQPVAVEARYVEGDGTPDAIDISWSPEESAAFPTFSGSLRTSSENDGDCRLTLEGTYTAPGGIAGAAFDMVVGGRIARATIHALLEQVRAAAEADYRTRSAL
jgi:hypothetical protein